MNPSAARGGGAEIVPRLRRVAGRLGASLAVSESGDHLRELARRAVGDGVERLVVAGGDGTLHLVVQELARSECALVPLAAGRGNDLTTCLDLRPVPERLEEWIGEGPLRRVDLGRAGDVWFGVHCGVGFDSEAARWANEQTIVGGILSYPLAVLRTLVAFEAPHLRVEHEGGVFDERAMFVVCANCWRFGGGMKVAPDAAIDDGLLDVVLVRRVSTWLALRLFALVYHGRHVDHPAVTVVKTPWARISLDREMEMYGDGEPMLGVGGEPLDVRVAPGARRVVGRP